MVFYFTGTGNSLYAAKMLDDEIVSIPQIVNSENLVFQSDKIGIVCPVYGHEMPGMVKEFLCKAVFHTDYLYLVLTYGNRHADAVELAAKALEHTGKRASYITTLLMVDNFLPAFDMEEQVKLNKDVDKQIADIQADIATRKQKYQNVTDKDRLAHKGYLELVHHQPETVWADFDFTDECVGCAICAKVCPVGCIHIKEQKAIRTDMSCQACYACVHACPKAAIHVKTIMGFQEKNPRARYRNEHIELAELIAANSQIEKERKKGS